MRYLIAVCFVVGMAGCVRSPVAPSTDVSGVWIGLSSTALGTETFTVTITQNGPALAGFWVVTFAGSASTVATGHLTGTAAVTGVSLTLTPDIQPNCNYIFTATLTTTTKMDGQFQTANCTTSSVESLELIKQ
jgi:hypothetical protein